MKGGIFGRRQRYISEDFTGASVVKLDRVFKQPDALQKIHGPDKDTVECLNRVGKGHAYRSLASKVVDFIGFSFLQSRQHTAKVRRDHLCQLHTIFDAELLEVSKGADLVIPRGTMYLVALLKQEIGEISAVLPGNTDDECLLQATAFLLR